MGLPRDHQKVCELLLKAGELGDAQGYYNVGTMYQFGDHVEVDEKKAKYYWELAAIGGHSFARYNLGVIEAKAGNHNRAKKHYLIAASAGEKRSLECVKSGFSRMGYVTKDEYASVLRTYQRRRDESKSVMRDKSMLTFNIMGR